MWDDTLFFFRGWCHLWRGVPEARHAGQGRWRRHHDVADADHDARRSRRGLPSAVHSARQLATVVKPRLGSNPVTKHQWPCLFQLVRIYGEALKATEERVAALQSKKN